MNLESARIHELFDGWRARSPDRVFLLLPSPAVIPGSTRDLLVRSSDPWIAGQVRNDSVATMTYAQVGALVDTLEAELRADGVRPGDRVLAVAENCPEHLALIVACSRVGAWSCGVNARMAPGEVAAFANKADARVHYFTGGVSRAAAAHASRFDALPSAVAGLLRSPVRAEAVAETGPLAGEVAAIIFTSGTSGTPKGVLMTHQQSLVACVHSVRAMHLTPEDVLPAAFPFAHIAGYRAAWQTAVLNGLRVDPVRTVDALGMLEMVQTNRSTILPSVPTVYQAMMEHEARNDFDLSSLRLAMTGGTTVPVDLIRQIRTRLGVPFVTTAYGMTETAGNISYCRIGDPDEVVAHSAGRPLDNLDVRVVGPDLAPLPQGRAGEIVVRGFQVTHGYLDDPAATAASLTPDGYFRTGDIGLIDAGGNVRITDRLKNMYICGGFNCYPAEIEQALCLLPGVSQVAVIGTGDRRLGEVGRAFIVPAGDPPLDEAAVIAWSRDNMAGYKVPRSVRFVDALPLNASGKVSKEILRAME